MNNFFFKHQEVPIKLLTQNKITMFAFKPPPPPRRSLEFFYCFVIVQLWLISTINIGSNDRMLKGIDLLAYHFSAETGSVLGRNLVNLSIKSA